MGNVLKAASHAVLATRDVGKINSFFATAFDIQPHFQNREFSEFVLPSGFRLAFFIPVGKSKERFSNEGQRHHSVIGLTVSDVDSFFENVETKLRALGAQTGGAPKEHPWGEKSFLLIDPDGNRWEITQSPSESGFIPNH